MSTNTVPRIRMKAITEEIRTQLEELAPIINSFNSEAVQLRFVDELLIPRLLDAERDAANDDYIEACAEYVLTSCAQLLRGDAAKQKELMSKCLRTLKELETGTREKIMREDACDDH